MKHLFSFLLLFTIAFQAIGQDVEIPKSYERQLKRQGNKVERLEKKYDIVLTPEESIPLPQIMVDAPANKDWGLDYLKVTEYAAKIRAKTGKRKVLVVGFDTAGALKHKSFDNCSVTGYDFTGEGIFDGHGHGTHISGTIASEESNIGVGQVLSIDGYLKIMPVKILHNAGYGKINEIIEAYKKINVLVKDYINAGWVVIYSNSWGGSGSIDPTLNKEFEAAENMGVIIVSASGNNGTGTIGQPASSEFSEAIGAIDKLGKRASFSQYGKGLSFVAPGVNIYSTYPGDLYAVLSGTSMATPHVSGLYALIASYWQKATPAELKAHFRKYATDIDPDGYDIFTGFGVPIIDKLLANEPGKVVDDPDDPIDDDPGDDPDEDVIKEKRTITISFDSLQIVWGIGSMTDQRPLDVEFTVDVETNLLAEVFYDRFDTFTDTFFRNRGIMFSDVKTDAWDAAKWTIFFYEMFADRDGFVCDVKEITFTDEQGRKMVRSGEGINPKMMVEASSIPQIFFK